MLPENSSKKLLEEVNVSTVGISLNSNYVPDLTSFNIKLEIVITRAAPAFYKLFMVMGCVFDINTVHKTVEKLTFHAFY